MIVVKCVVNVINDKDIYAYKDKFGKIHIDQFVKLRQENGLIKEQTLNTSDNVKLIMRYEDVERLF